MCFYVLWIKAAQKFSLKSSIKDTFTCNTSYSDKKKNSLTCTPDSPNQGSPIPKVRNNSIQNLRYNWRRAVDRSVLATLGGEGGEGWKALTSHCPLYPAQPPEHGFQQDFGVGPGTASVPEPLVILLGKSMKTFLWGQADTVQTAQGNFSAF